MSLKQAILLLFVFNFGLTASQLYCAGPCYMGQCSKGFVCNEAGQCCINSCDENYGPCTSPAQCSAGWCINGTCCGQASCGCETASTQILDNSTEVTEATGATLSPTPQSNVTGTPWQTLINNITMATQTPSNKQCPIGWYRESTNSNKCIKFVTEIQPWFGAKFDCSTLGNNATLISIEQAFENSEICRFPTSDNTKECAAFDRKTCKWFNEDCNTPQCYICQQYI
uniref:C-type lectin domain-containing protein n=1 Tax=Acrobeloides nanus TaxID=290746 RepID=A0A914CEU5_9BILA